jgi:hypothetical protein
MAAEEVLGAVVIPAYDDPATFLAEFTERAWNSRFASSTRSAASLPYKVAADVVRPVFESMVGLFDHGNLLERFLALPMPRHGHVRAGTTASPTSHDSPEAPPASLVRRQRSSPNAPLLA